MDVERVIYHKMVCAGGSNQMQGLTDMCFIYFGTSYFRRMQGGIFGDENE